MILAKYDGLGASKLAMTPNEMNCKSHLFADLMGDSSETG